MSDQCMNCTVRGDLKECLSTDCSQHESWMTQEVMKQLKASQDECEELKKMQDHLKWKDETRKQLKVSREEIDQLKAEVKKKKNRIGILNRSLRRLKKE